ncbi:hypothetical protein BWI93_27165 [Siphonobacter sp. BAB-5385]|nr:hypothetical protein BWI93_27165 [Siphonobacter sp. BAB-5385]
MKLSESERSLFAFGQFYKIGPKSSLFNQPSQARLRFIFPRLRVRKNRASFYFSTDLALA